jgi:PleD family two-component response regulator
MLNKVLVVEDDPITCELIHEVLSSAEIEAHAVTDSAQAAAQLRTIKFDAVFLDVHMPPPDGIELARQMRASRLNQKTVIVMITGEEDRGVLGRAFQVGANFFLFKPVDRQVLLRLMRVTQGPIDRERRWSEMIAWVLSLKTSAQRRVRDCRNSYCH